MKHPLGQHPITQPLGHHPIKLPLGQHPIKPDLGQILPNYAKSSYDDQQTTTTTSSKKHLPRLARDTSTDIQSSLSSESQFRVTVNTKREGEVKERWRKRDEYDELDSAVDMFKHLL